MRKAALILLSALLMVSCKYNEPVTSEGSFTIDGESHSFTSLRVDHVGYVGGSDSTQFILRLTAYPGTFSMDTVSHKGYGTVLQIFFVAKGCDLRPGDMTDVISSDSVSRVLTISESGDTTKVIPLSGASVAVSAANDNFQRYDFTLTAASGPSTGQYTGKHIVNRLVDQPALGFISFDTIHTSLAAPVLYRWGHLFSNEYYYYELIFYSTNSRFSDDGRLRQGVQFSLGLTSTSDRIPLSGLYNVSESVNPGCVMYGHKVNDAHWGTYWNVLFSGSSVGKANILSGSVPDFMITDTTLSFSFGFTDQLGNDVLGGFSGIYSVN